MSANAAALVLYSPSTVECLFQFGPHRTITRKGPFSDSVPVSQSPNDIYRFFGNADTEAISFTMWVLFFSDVNLDCVQVGILIESGLRP